MEIIESKVLEKLRDSDAVICFKQTWLSDKIMFLV